MLLRSPGPISPDTYSGHIRRRALCPNRLRNGMSQRSSSSCQSDILPTMVGPSKSRPPMSHRKTDLGIPCRAKSAKVVLGGVLINAQLRRSFEAIDVNASAAAYGRSPNVCHAGLVYVGAISSNTSVIARILSMRLLDTLSDGRVSSRHVLGRGHRCGCSDRKSNQKCKGKLVCVPHELSFIRYVDFTPCVSCVLAQRQCPRRASTP